MILQNNIYKELDHSMMKHSQSERKQIYKEIKRKEHEEKKKKEEEELKKLEA